MQVMQVGRFGKLTESVNSLNCKTAKLQNHIFCNLIFQYNKVYQLI